VPISDDSMKHSFVYEIQRFSDLEHDNFYRLKNPHEFIFYLPGCHILDITDYNTEEMNLIVSAIKKFLLKDIKFVRSYCYFDLILEGNVTYHDKIRNRSLFGTDYYRGVYIRKLEEVSNILPLLTYYPRVHRVKIYLKEMRNKEYSDCEKIFYKH